MTEHIPESDLDFFRHIRVLNHKEFKEKVAGPIPDSHWLATEDPDDDVLSTGELISVLANQFYHPSAEMCQRFYRGFVEWRKLHGGDGPIPSELAAITVIEDCLRKHWEGELDIWRKALDCTPDDIFFTASANRAEVATKVAERALTFIQ